jgi:hypothetical protein
MELEVLAPDKKSQDAVTATMYRFYKMAADRGYAEAQMRVGLSHLPGSVDGEPIACVEEDLAEGLRWLERAVAQEGEAGEEAAYYARRVKQAITLRDSGEVELPVEIASAATSLSLQLDATVETMLAGTRVWLTDKIPQHQEESTELKVPDGSVVTGFNIASFYAPGRWQRPLTQSSQMRIDEVGVDGSIGKELFGWNHCGYTAPALRHGDPWGYAPKTVVVTTTSTRFKVSVRHTDIRSNNESNGGGCSAGVAIFRAVGTAAQGTEPEVSAWHERFANVRAAEEGRRVDRRQMKQMKRRPTRMACSWRACKGGLRRKNTPEKQKKTATKPQGQEGKGRL